MILVSKILLGSVALATLAVSVVFPDAGESAGAVASSMQAGVTAEGKQADGAQVEPAAPGSVHPLHPLPHCPGRCEFWALLAQVR